MRGPVLAILLGVGVAATAAPARPVPDKALPEMSGRVERRYKAEEARQGVAVGPDRFYAIGDREIAAYDRETGRRLAHWSGDPAHFTHLNSCIVDGRRLVCAHSNYPGVPMESSIEKFDAMSLRPIGSRSIGAGIGSLTWLTRHVGVWWAGFANYDGRGGAPGRDHRDTMLVKYDAQFREVGRWRFPESVLSRFAPRSSSGGVWGDDGLLYVTGHDRPEVLVLTVPQRGQTLEHVATIGISTGGQAIAWDPVTARRLWSIDRDTAEVVVTQLPPLPQRSMLR